MYKTTKFEEIGVQKQLDAYTKEYANKMFHYSCRVCCERGMCIDCDKCAISYVHTMVMSAFEVSEKKCAE